MTVTADDLAGLRQGLLAFCYQMLGSPFDAEDAVQDVMERAWRSRDSFDPGRASLSTWTYRIARNVCIDRLRAAPRKALPRDLRDPGLDVGAPLVPALDVPWLMPAPTSWWSDSEVEGEIVAAEEMRLAVTAVLQSLPPRQRGVFILREVLGQSAAETAEILEMTVPGVNSALQRARSAVGRDDRPSGVQPGAVERYAQAIVDADVTALAALVTDDVLFEMPPVPQWSRGREPYAAFMAHLFEWQGREWATRVVSANGQAVMLLYLVTADGPQPHTVQLFDGDGSGGIGHVLVYRDDRLFQLFEATD